MFILKEPITHTQEIKKSRFVAHAVRVETEEEARAELDSLSDKEATHNCYAYKIGNSYRFSDDGEPGGTAGRPILSAIEGQEMDQILVVVTRYFGGIKLGTGGLVRAYGGTAAKCLNAAFKIRLRPRTTLQVHAPFEATGPVFALLETYGAIVHDQDYTQQGLRLTLELDEADLQNFTRDLTDATRGQGQIHH